MDPGSADVHKLAVVVGAKPQAEDKPQPMMDFGLAARQNGSRSIYGSTGNGCTNQV
jgi:hypothetical protein